MNEILFYSFFNVGTFCDDFLLKLIKLKSYFININSTWTIYEENVRTLLIHVVYYSKFFVKYFFLGQHHK